MITREDKNISIVRQCELLSISRSSVYRPPKGESSVNKELMELIDNQYMETPFYGSRKMTLHLHRAGHKVGRHRVRRLMRKMGIEAIYQTPRTSISNPQHKTYPYLLKNLEITDSNHVWCADITYIPIGRGFLYLIAIMDWASRKVLSWRLSNTMDTFFCIEALEEALCNYGTPKIFNTDQGSQFTSIDFTDVLKNNGIRISMDGKGRWVDNVFIERLWRSIKYECIYPKQLTDGRHARKEIENWFTFYNKRRPHLNLHGQTPNEIYNDRLIAA